MKVCIEGQLETRTLLDIGLNIRFVLLTKSPRLQLASLRKHVLILLIYLYK